MHASRNQNKISHTHTLPSPDSRNINLLVEQIKEFRPVCASTQTPEDAALVRSMLADAGVKCEIYHGIEGVDEVAKCEEADTVVTGIVGAVGLQVRNKKREKSQEGTRRRRV